MPEPGRPEGPRRNAGWPLWAALIAVLVGGAVMVAVRARAPIGGPPFAPPQHPDTLYMSRIRTLQDVTAAPDPARFANYRVELSNLPVVEVVGRAFWVTDEEGRRILVVPNNPDTPTDAVGEGRTVSITGAVRTPDRPERIARRKGVDREIAELAAGQTVYLRADSIRPGAVEFEPREVGD
jgi:hypothetical protein